MSRKRSLMSRYHGISKQNPNHAAELHVFRLTMSAYKHRGKKKSVVLEHTYHQTLLSSREHWR